jgi:hypothetical protein
MTTQRVDPGSSRSHRTNKRFCRALLALAITTLFTAPGASAATASYDPLYATPTPSIITSEIDPTNGYYTILNTSLGAQRFYDNGYLGFHATLANVEAGYVWPGHETLANVTSFISNSPANATASQYDYHATAVGFVMVGQGPFPYYYYQLGVAPEAGLASVAIASDWVGSQGQFNVNSSTFVYGYNTVMSAPVTTTHQSLSGFSMMSTSRVDVINSSWGFDDPAAKSQVTQIIDSLTYAYHQTVCISAGNHEHPTDPTTVSGPAVAFNAIAVGALGGDLTDPKYNAVADFSNTGPNDFYNPVTRITTHGVRAAVSIAAPGTDLILPAYTGKTGTNSDGTLFDTSSFPPDDLNKLYFLGVSGTSFSSPIVAGGAALLADAGHVNFGGGPSVDGRVIKAVLLNSARKTPGWTNHTVLSDGVLTTTQGLDWSVGAGALDLNAAYDQYLTGTTNDVPLTGGTVRDHGWAFGHVAAGTPVDYILDTPLAEGAPFTATLTWFIPAYFNVNALPNADDNFSDADLHDLYFDQLDLQVWQVVDGALTTLIADSSSPYNNVDHLYFQIPRDGTYAIRVNWVGITYDLLGTSPKADDYALAWSVPEPVSATFLLLGLSLTCLRRQVRSQVRSPAKFVVPPLGGSW